MEDVAAIGVLYQAYKELALSQIMASITNIMMHCCYSNISLSLSVRDEDAPAKISDENAVKPDGWLDDESEYIGDPNAIKPDDW